MFYSPIEKRKGFIFSMDTDNPGNFETKWIGKEHFHKDVTDSTNHDVKELAVAGAKDGTVVSAKMQTAGRGRRGRSWISEKGDNLLFSLLLRPDIRPDVASQITLLMALAVAKALREQYEFDAKIKWPNDVVIGGKKVCGILTEMYLAGTKMDYIIVGCGVNVNQISMPEELSDIATSLFMESNCVFMTDEIMRAVLVDFEQYYDRFLLSGSLEEFTDEYNTWLISLNKEVRVLDPKGEFEGISRGINDKGELMVQLADGSITDVYAGEVSVRGLYGYV